MGFLPYWRVDDTRYIRLELLSEINYFSLSVNNEGKIKKVVDGQTDPGWREFQTETIKNLITKSQIYGTEFTVTVAALNNDLIETILDSEAARTTLIAEIVSLVKEYNLNGVNIDFEYAGTPDRLHQQTFSDWSKQLSTQLKKEAPGTSLSLSIMPLSARPGPNGEPTDLFEFAKLSSVYDRFIGMSYDFYGENSDIAGPIAPMKGFKDNKFFFDVETMYEDFAKVLPKNKIVMGIPYYGWDWAVQSGKTINSLTLSRDNPDDYRAVISYARAREDKNLKPKQCTWDDYALETWCWYTKDGIDHQVWLADNKSVAARFDFAKKQNLGGIGIWVLGYDKNYNDLWEMIEEKFAQN